MTASGLILLLGQTGVGKSTFINIAGDHKQANDSDDLEGSQSKVAAFVVGPPSNSARRAVMLVDTPGFNDTWKKDVQILGKIIEWLKEQNQEMMVHGILYLHNIGVRPPSGVGSVSPRSLSDTNLAKNICLVTVDPTRQITPPTLARREQDLKANSWNLMDEAGSKIMRFESTRESAWKILDHVMGMQSKAVPVEKLAREMERICDSLSARTPSTNSRGLLPGFFSSLFGRRR